MDRAQRGMLVSVRCFAVCCDRIVFRVLKCIKFVGWHWLCSVDWHAAGLMARAKW